MSNLPSNPAQFRDTVKTLSPPWLTTGNAEKYMYTLGLCSDLLLEKMNQAVKIRLPGEGDVTQIPYLANDRVLVQGPEESNESFIERLKEAFATWKKAGSRVAVLGQLQAYLQNIYQASADSLFPDVNAPLMRIVSANATVATWSTLNIGDPIGQEPALMTEANPANFNWDGTWAPWRTWLIFPQSLQATGQAGFDANFANTVIPGNITPPGMLGTGAQAGVWVPSTSGENLPSPYAVITGLTGITSANLQQWIYLSNGSYPFTNTGWFQIVAVNSPTSVTIAGPNPGQNSFTLPDAAPNNWEIGYYPFIGPGPTWGSAGYVFGQGQLTQPPKDTGSNIGGVWQPTTASDTFTTTLSWGLSVSPLLIDTLRSIIQTWKSASTWYQNIIITFANPQVSPFSASPVFAYDPGLSAGSGNPNGTFGSHGMNVNGVWTPTGLIFSQYDCFCQGTGSWSQCSVQNVT